ncbi:hypothetical protein K443DRAFT_13527 [Laccaria amethystina LaAM-08-1]|uniref:Uncharacterized protein n=1 Tax=Laccaria amethystina LaAM-08-1 TaxID=1095629 RepID=A0A0C9WI89_9AGAR|nr:hypothetical protein K443DRAFT_13527 [Laccaria amethystina LaAM-08-1]
MTQHQQSALPPILFTTTTKQDDERTPQRRNAMGMAIVCANQGAMLLKATWQLNNK